MAAKRISKQRLPVVKWNKKHPSKQVVPITCTFEEMFSAIATFEGLWVVFLRQIKNTCTVLWSV